MNDRTTNIENEVFLRPTIDTLNQIVDTTNVNIAGKVSQEDYDIHVSLNQDEHTTFATDILSKASNSSLILANNNINQIRGEVDSLNILVPSFQTHITNALTQINTLNTRVNTKANINNASFTGLSTFQSIQATGNINLYIKW